MLKTSKGRVADTRAYVAAYAAAGLPANIRQDISTMVGTRFPRATAAQRLAFDQLSSDMSVANRLGVGVARGTPIEREQRRAIVLLWSALGSTQADPTATNARIQRGMSLAPGALAAELTAVMQKAAVVASNAGAAHVFLTDFVANPLAFIQRHRLFIFGTTAGQAKLVGAAIPAASYRNVIAFYFCYNAEADRFELAPQQTAMHGGSHLIWSVSVPAIHWSDVENRGLTLVPTALNAAGFQDLRGIELAGATFMVTTQFTGCAFCYSEQGGTAYAAHVSPAGIPGKPVLTGQVLAHQLMGTHAATGITGGVFSNWPGGPPPPLEVFGNGVGNAAVLGGNAFYPPKVPAAGVGQMKWTSIFGVRNGGAWAIYSQSIDGTLLILEARQIF